MMLVLALVGGEHRNYITSFVLLRRTRRPRDNRMIYTQKYFVKGFVTFREERGPPGMGVV